MSIFVLSSHSNPIGDRNDVRALLLLFSMLGLCLPFLLFFFPIISHPVIPPPPLALSPGAAALAQSGVGAPPAL